MASSYLISEIKRLNTEEGLFDTEIGKILGMHRGSVNRIRHENDIPIANIRMRKDKKCVCTICRIEFFIRRNQWRKLYCSVCQVKYEELKKIRKKIRESKKAAVKRQEAIKQLRYIEYNY